MSARVTRLSAEQGSRMAELDERELRQEALERKWKEVNRDLRGLSKTLRGLALGKLSFAERDGEIRLQPTAADPDKQRRWSHITAPASQLVTEAIKAVLRDPKTDKLLHVARKSGVAPNAIQKTRRENSQDTVGR